MFDNIPGVAGPGPIFGPRDDRYMEVVYGDWRNLVLVSFSGFIRTSYRNNRDTHKKARERMEMVSTFLHTLLFNIERHFNCFFSLCQNCHLISFVYWMIVHDV